MKCDAFAKGIYICVCVSRDHWLKNLAVIFCLISDYYRSNAICKTFNFFLFQEELLAGAVAGTISVSNMTKPTSGFIYFGVSTFRANTIVFACPGPCRLQDSSISENLLPLPLLPSLPLLFHLSFFFLR